MKNVFAAVIARQVPDRVAPALEQRTLEPLSEYLQDVMYQEYLDTVVKPDGIVLQKPDMLLVSSLQALMFEWRHQTADYKECLETLPQYVDKLATLGMGIDVMGSPQWEGHVEKFEGPNTGG